MTFIRPLALFALLGSTTALAQDAQIRVLHLSPDAPNVDVFVNDGTPAAITDLGFTEGTGYIPLPPDTYNFKVSPTGTTTSDAVLDIDLPLMADTDYTAVAFDEVANIQPLALVDDSDNIAAGTIRYQIVHAAVGVGVVDIGTRSLGYAPVATDFEFGETTVVDVPAGDLEITLDVGADRTADFRFDVPALGDGILVNVFAVTDDMGAPFLLAQLPDGSTARVDGVATEPARVRAVHLSPDAPSVDVYLDALAAPGLMFQQTTPYVDLTAGTHTVGLAVAGTTQELFKVNAGFGEGLDYTVVAFDDAASLDVAVFRDGNDVPATDTRFRIIHAADGVGQVDIYDEGTNTLLVQDLDFGADAGLQIPSSAVTVGLDADNDGTSDFLFDVPMLGGGVFANVFAVADASGPFLFAVLPDSTTARIDPR